MSCPASPRRRRASTAFPAAFPAAFSTAFSTAAPAPARAFACAVAILLALAPSAPASGAKGASGANSATGLGHITFPVPCSQPARTHFVRGVLAVHSFFYDEAEGEFAAATRADPRCLMGYWGQAMAHDRTLWGSQDTAAGRAALARAEPLLAAASPRDRAYLAAARALFGKDGDKTHRPERLRAYRAALRRMHQLWPADDEIAALYALALISSDDHGAPPLRARMQAGAIALDILARNPRHPGAAHYAIHAFDDPDHAVLALPAARILARIAPDAPHARHMPAHIFVELGRWKPAVDACESAWKASLEWIARRHHPRTWADFHSLSWLGPLYVERGQVSRAERVLHTFGETVGAGGEGAGAAAIYIHAVLAVVRDTGRWNQLEALLAPADAALPALDARAARDRGKPDAWPAAAATRAGLFEARALAAARGGDVRTARALYRKMVAQHRAAVRLATGAYGIVLRENDRAAELRVEGEIAAARHRLPAAERALRKAAEIEAAVRAGDGADPAAASSYERLGELYLAAGRAADASKAFAIALERRPGRAPALLGAAHAADALHDDDAAAERWRQLAHNWRDAEPGTPGLTEARGHVTAHR